MEKINAEELEKHVPKKGEMIAITIPIKDKNGKIINERVMQQKVLAIKVNKKTGEMTLKTKVQCPDMYSIEKRKELADEIVEKIRPQIVETADKAVRDSLARQSTPARLKRIKEQVDKTPTAKVEVMGKKGCLFLKVGKKKYLL